MSKMKKQRSINPARVVLLGFCLIILLGAVLLWLPFSSRSGEFTNPLTALFTATSATCVTGLAKVDTFLYWSPVGQGVILALIQVGGLGFVTMISILSFLLNQKFSLSQRLVMATALNMNNVSGVVGVVRRAIIGTFFLEFCGAVLLSFRFVPLWGWGKGLWFSVFHSISAFCNGGFDLMGGHTGEFSSFVGFSDDPLVLLTLIFLINAGGLGFFVWEDLIEQRGRWSGLSLYSQICIVMSGSLVALGFVMFALLEWHNPDTLGYMSTETKLLNALFQSCTLRTAGFATIDQGALTDGAALVSIGLMLIGGSSGSTAGGLKTVTVAVLMLALRQNMKGHNDVVVSGRRIPHHQVLNAMVLLQMMLVFFFCGSLALTITDEGAFLPAVYEAASAIGTVGLSMNLTPNLNALSSLVIVLLMFLGRVGILSCSIAFLTSKRKADIVKYPTYDLFIG